MCGILGSINLLETGRHLDSIKHRGPDAYGSHTFRVNKHQVELHHRRLSIVDLSEAGKQPMFSLNKKECITYNGEVYNHNQLKEALSDVSFNGHSDTETIVNYFSKFGIANCLKHLNGIFAFAYLDLDNGLLHLARDRYGVKPLYYYFKDNKLLFSSELRPLKACLDPDIEEGILLHSLRMRYTSSPGTIYKDIYKVEPGQLLTFRLSKDITLSKEYYAATPKSLGTRKGDYRQLVKEYGDLFTKAVEKQLMADVEVGILLSGGIDSALVAAIAKEKSATAVKAFTIGFEGEHNTIDEIKGAQETAAVLGLDHYYRKISISDFLSSIRQVAKIVEEPIGTTSIIPMYFLSELAASKVKVVLSGQGADEPLGGYNKYKALNFIEKTRLFQPLMWFTKGGQILYNGSEKYSRLFSAIQCSENLDSLIELNAVSSISEVSRLMKNLTGKRTVLKEKENLFKTIWKNRTPTEAAIRDLFLYYDLRTSLADDLLMYTDKISMHFGLECRVPILDNELIEFIESLHSHYKFNSRRGKIIHKDFATEYLPSSIINRKKLGFKSPTETWFKESLDSIRDLFHANEQFKSRFNLGAVETILQTHYKGKNKEKQIFQLLSIACLLSND